MFRSAPRKALGCQFVPEPPTMSRILKSSSGRLKHMAAGVATGAAAGFVLNPLLFPAGAIAGGFYGNKVYCENAAKQMRIKELGTRFDTEGTTCASCGAPKSKKGGLGNCYGCGKLFCSSCREKSFSFKVEEEELSVNLKVCDSCHEDLNCITMSDADLGDDGSEPSTPLYDFSSFQAASSAGPVPSAFDTAPAAAAAPRAAAPAYASGLGQVPPYATGGSFQTFTSPVAPSYTATSPSTSALYPALGTQPSAPVDTYGMSEASLIPDLSATDGDRLERVMTAASFFPEAPVDDLPSPSAPGDSPSAPTAQTAHTSISTLDLDTNTGPELQFACEQVAAAAATPANDRLEGGQCTEVPGDDEKKDWEASWDLPPAVLAQRALEKLKVSDHPQADTGLSNDINATAEPGLAATAPVDAKVPAVADPVVPAATVASLFPSAPDHDFST